MLTKNFPFQLFKQNKSSLKFFSNFNTSNKLSSYKFSTKLEKSFPSERFFEVEDKTGLIFTLEDKPGVLMEALKVFSKHGVNLSYINSRPSKFSMNSHKNVDFFVDFDGKIQDTTVQAALAELKSMTSSVKEFKTEEVPWFPKSITDLNQMGRSLMAANEALASDHPGFKDEVYRKRRQEIVNISNSYYMEDGENIPLVDYTQDETELWGFIWDKLTPLHKKYAADEFLNSFNDFNNKGVYSRNKIPQLKEISQFLKKKTNTIFRPVGGLLTQREFLNGLAFRVFHSTQYIRHKSAPLYTPEPDIIHEILGHAPLFANKDFADFSQEIGMASLAASDEDIAKLGTIYWFTIEFGVCLQRNERKIYGAGILSSPSEIEWAASDKPTFHPFDIFKVANQPYTITDIQTNYFLAPSFEEMKRQFLKYSETIKKPFNITYNVEKLIMEIDRHISTRRESNIPQGDKLF